MVRLVIQTVCTGVALRAVPRSGADRGRSPIGRWSTSGCNGWGHAVLTAAKEHAEDWAWLVDHSVQIGQDKCLVILGIRLAALPPPGTALVASDLELIALVPRPSWTAPLVSTQPKFF